MTSLLFLNIFVLVTLPLANLQVVQHLSIERGISNEPLGPEFGTTVCCEIISEAEIDMNFFTQLCKSVIEREMETEAGIKAFRKEIYPPPGMMERCRKTIEETCHLDLNSFIQNNKTEKVAFNHNNETVINSTQYQLNITECLLGALARKTAARRTPKIILQPSYIHQERPLFVTPLPENLALKEKGSVYPPRIHKIKSFPHQTQHRNTDVLSYIKEENKSDESQFLIVEPIYKLGVTVFFIFALTKMVMNKPEESHSAPKTVNGSLVHGNGVMKLDKEVEEDDDEEPPSLINADDMQTACEDFCEKSEVEESAILDQIGDNLQVQFEEDTKMSVISMEVEEEKQSEEMTDEVFAEKECVVVTGRMLISLLGTKKEAEHLFVTRINVSAEEI